MPERSHENSYYQIFGLLVQGQCVFGKGVGGFKIHGITCGMAQKGLSLRGIKRDNIGYFTIFERDICYDRGLRNIFQRLIGIIYLVMIRFCWDLFFTQS